MNQNNFVWGVATSAYQIEGAYKQDGKGDSIWDVFSHEKSKIKHGDNGDVACNHYNLFKEDKSISEHLTMTESMYN